MRVFATGFSFVEVQLTYSAVELWFSFYAVSRPATAGEKLCRQSGVLLPAGV